MLIMQILQERLKNILAFPRPVTVTLFLIKKFIVYKDKLEIMQKINPALLAGFYYTCLHGYKL